MCEKELPKRDEFGVSEGLLVPPIFVFDTFAEKGISQEGCDDAVDQDSSVLTDDYAYTRAIGEPLKG